MDWQSKKKHIKRITIDWLKLIVLMLDEAAILAVVLVILHYTGALAKITLPATIGLSIGLFILVFLLHLAIIPVFHKKPVTGIESMIGMKCRVTETLNPGGMVAIKNEYWRAESLEGQIDAGEEAEVVDSNGLMLKVKRSSK